MSGSPGSSLHVDLKIFISVTLLRLIVEGVVGGGGGGSVKLQILGKKPSSSFNLIIIRE